MYKPKVSVSLITYNQEKYIAACLNSIISQITDFDFEVVIADDCSKDKTPEIIADYALKYPKLIKPILRKANLGLVQNAVKTIEACTGQYIALMEGDDFWIDNHKLQIQADYLDKNKDCVICFTNEYAFYEDSPDKKLIFFTDQNRPPEKFDLGFLINHNVKIPNNTKMFRREAQPTNFPDWYFVSVNWDWVLHIMQAQKGKIGYIDQITLAYRRHPGALHMSNDYSAFLHNGIVTMNGVNKYLNYKYKSRLNNLWWEYHQLAFAYLNDGRFTNFLRYYIKYLLSPNKPDDFKLKDDFWLLRRGLLKKQ
jgi:glycosyltransferase involved in cell wall biosynthesis